MTLLGLPDLIPLSSGTEWGFRNDGEKKTGVKMADYRAKKRGNWDSESQIDRLIASKMLYTPEQRARRDSSIWTPIQGFLAIAQFVVFAVSLALVINTLVTGTGVEWALWSVVVKTMFLYTIMITGSLWEKAVFGRYLFAPAFYWEDVVSMAVIASHTAYLVFLAMGYPTETLMVTALVAYGLYAINAAQFVLKLRQARLEGASLDTSDASGAVEGGVA